MQNQQNMMVVIMMGMMGRNGSVAVPDVMGRNGSVAVPDVSTTEQQRNEEERNGE